MRLTLFADFASHPTPVFCSLILQQMEWIARNVGAFMQSNWDVAETHCRHDLLLKRKGLH
jgi:hypothetical protein